MKSMKFHDFVAEQLTKQHLAKSEARRKEFEARQVEATFVVLDQNNKRIRIKPMSKQKDKS
jgi:hypothetical protein